jgi:hypothetical protein
MAQIEQKEVDAIEAIIDRVGMAQFTEAISAIAVAKSIHVEENWQDKNLAKVWTRIARKFDKLIPALELNDDVLGFRR